MRTIDCTDLVELITDYLEGSLPEARRHDIDVHLTGCPDCAAAVEQFRRTVELAGRLADDLTSTLSPATRAELLAIFRRRSPEISG